MIVIDVLTQFSFGLFFSEFFSVGPQQRLLEFQTLCVMIVIDDLTQFSSDLFFSVFFSVGPQQRFLEFETDSFYLVGSLCVMILIDVLTSN